MEDLTDRERLIQLSTKMDGLNDVLADIKRDVEKVDRKIDKIESNLKRDYVTKAEFEPIKRAVYGGIGIVLTSVILVMLTFFLNGGGSLISNVP